MATANQNIGQLLRREPILILWAVFVVSIPFLVLNAGMPQPGNLLVLFMIRRARKWSKGWHPSLARTIKPMLWFSAWTLLVNYTWAIVTGVFDYKDYGLYPLYYFYNVAVLFVALAAYNKHGDSFLRLTLYCVFISVVLQIVLSFVFPVGMTRGALFFKSPNQLGYYALLVACLVAINRRRLEFGLGKASVALIGCAYLAAISASRASLAGIALVFLLLVFSNPRIIVLGSVVAVTLLSLGGPVFEAIESSQGRFADDQHHDRSFVEERGYNRLAQYPQYIVFGAGEGDTQRFSENHTKMVEIHSVVGTVVFAYGIVGLGFFVVFVRRVLKGASTRAVLMLTPVLLYTFAHQALRFTMMWIVLAVFLALKTPTAAKLRAVAAARKAKQASPREVALVSA